MEGYVCLQKYFKDVILHTPAAALGPPFFILNNARQMEGFTGSICDTESSLFICLQAAYPLQQAGEVRSNLFTPINQS